MGSTGGWNRPASNQPVKKGGAKAPSVARGIIAGLAVAVPLVVLLVWMFTGDEARPVEVEKERGHIKAVTPAAAPKSAVPAPKKERIAKPKTAEDVLQNLETLPKPEMPKRELTPEEWDRITNRVFKTGIEQLMANLFSTVPGDMPMPMPSIGEEEKRDMAAILITKNIVGEGDSENLAIAKEQVDLAKKELAKYIGDGGDPDGFMQYYFEELRHAFNLRNDALAQLREINDEDPDAAGEVLKKVNESFDQHGIRHITKGEL